MNNIESEALIKWIDNKILSVKFGEIRISLKVHSGRPTLLEKSIIEKTQLTGITGGNNEESKYR